MKNFLSKPYPITSAPRSLIISSVSFGAFVFAFLYVFQPFGLGQVPGGLLGITLGYGLITTFAMLMVFFVVRSLFSRFYQEDSWTVGKEILNTMAIILLVALGNMLYSGYVGFFRINLEMLMMFLGFTLAVGIFPVSIQVLLRQNALQRKYNDASESINEDIHQKRIDNDLRAITLLDADEKPVLSCTSDELIAMESADNYVKIYYTGKAGDKNIMVRNALGNFEKELEAFDHFFRTHRTFLVNLHKLEHVDGNARGYTIKLKGLQKPIPVARRRTEAFDKAMAAR